MAGTSKHLAPQTSLFPRQIPQMPAGYYSGDQPNPHLRAFVAAHLAAHPFDPATDDYAIPAFDQPIETTKATAIYNMHTYWSKKPHDAIRQYIAHYTQPGDLVLDPFCGSGGTALAALMEGRAALAIDRSPAATFITKNYCTPVDVDALQDAFEDLKAKVQLELDWLYATRCDRCDGPATTGYTVYSQVFQCPRCLSRVPLFDCAEVDSLTKDGKPKKIRVCPYCQARGFAEEIRMRDQKFGAVPVMVSYLCQHGCKPARAERRHNDPDPKKRDYFARYDLGKLAEIEGKEIPHWFPTTRMMNAAEDTERWGLLWRPYLRGIVTVADFFTKRNLWALAAIKDAAEQLPSVSARDTVLFALTAVVLGMSKMNQYRPDVTYPTSTMKGTYYVPQIYQEEPPLTHIVNKIGNCSAQGRVER
jgi:hypothetical protein